MTPLTLTEKLAILTEGAKYDVSCSSSGSTRRAKGGVGNAAQCGICHSWTADGRCVSLLKVLLTNICVYDCVYCVNRRSNDLRRTMLTPEEVADLTIGFYRRNYIEGLFLSSGIVRDPDYTMELLNRAVRLLRVEHRFNGYIHMKIVPGADPRLVAEAGSLADRVSVNIELPTSKSLMLMAPEKTRESVIVPMRQVSDLISENREERKVTRKIPKFAPAGQSTQLVVGASNDSDLQILQLAEGLYSRMGLRRVYYSAFIPVNQDIRLPALPKPPLLREHRLYQADWLLRYYGFQAHEIVDDGFPELDLAVDPKAAWALRHLDLFPVEVNKAEHGILLRVPGIGVRSAARIVQARRVGRLTPDDLPKLGVVMKRARFFLTAQGKFCGDIYRDAGDLKVRLMQPDKKRGSEQLSLFPEEPAAHSAIGGEL